MKISRSVTIACCIMTAASALFAQTPAWISLNAGPVRTVLQDSRNRLILGTQGGVVVSTDNGKSWPVHGLYKPVWAAAVDSAGYIYAGSEKGVIYTSSDGGRSWTASPAFGRMRFTAAVVDSAGTVFFASESYGLFASTDHGKTWHGAGLDGTTVSALALAPQHRLFAATYNGGLSCSTDGGAVWTGTSLAGTNIQALAAGPGGEILAGAPGVGVCRSSDNGATWQPFGLSGKAVSYLTFGPDGTAYAAASDTLFSTHGNDTAWTPVPAPWTAQTNALGFAAGGAIFAAAGNTLFRSAPPAPWKQLTVDTDGKSADAIAWSGSRLVAASSSAGIATSGNGGHLWERDDTANVLSGVQSLLALPNGRLLAGTSFGTVLLSGDSGSHWIATGFTSANPLVTALAAGPGNQVFASVLGDGVARSTDGGASWNPASSGLSSLFVRSLLVSRTGPVLAGTDEGLYLSTNGGNGWARLPGLTGTVWCLLEDAHGVLYAGTGERGVYRSTDGGSSWLAVNNGLACLAARALVCDSSGVLYAGTFGGGVYRSTDGGVAWSALNTGLTDPGILCLSVDRGGTLYAGTWQHWLFALPLSPTSEAVRQPAPLASSMVLEQNYPNPFNPSTLLRYSLPRAGAVHLEVFNALGQRVAGLVEAVETAGVHEVRFDGAGLASGMYLYRLTSGAFTAAKRMLLVK